MIQPSDDSKIRKVPKIDSGTDVPNEIEDQSDCSLQEIKNVENKMDVLKFSLGSNVLGWCLFLMVVCILLSIWKPENELVKNGFEAFKLIVMTVLGYIFGSSKSE